MSVALRAPVERSASQHEEFELRPGHIAKGQVIGSTVLNGQTIPGPRYSAILPTRDFDGDIEQACLTAGQSAGNINEILPAATR